MTDVDRFHLLDPEDRGGSRRELLMAREIPRALSDHREGAKHYQPSPSLCAAVNVALAVGAPLLLTGEAGTGKTQVGFYLADYFAVEVFPLYVRSSTTADDLLYRFDAVAYFHRAHDPECQGKALDRGLFVEHGPLWKAYLSREPSVVLIDEIDKAPRDFPNDLLNVLDQHRFRVREKEPLEATGDGKEFWVERPAASPPPIVVITSNSERRLPEPFLRRCIFHHIEFTRELVERAVRARAGDFPRLDEATHKAAIDRFMDIRGRGLRKPPATAELLVWLTVLSARGGVNEKTLSSTQLKELPALGALVKDRDDWSSL